MASRCTRNNQPLKLYYIGETYVYDYYTVRVNIDKNNIACFAPPTYVIEQAKNK